jgi:hypothetical protein
MCVPILAAPREGFPQSPSDLGVAQGNNVLNMYGTKSGITNNISNPLTSSNTPMTTVDGSVSFSGQIQCPNSQKFMEVLIQPGTTGDIDTFIVSQDTTFSGTLNYTYEVPFPVSGLCANGVIACAPGTWTNCQTYQWTSNGSGQVSLAVAPLTALGGCFCVNNSCGANLVFDNTQTIMNVIGGGVASAIQKNDSRYAISNVVIDGMDATYYGQNSGGCVAPSSMPANAEEYYYNPGTMSSDATAEAAAESASPTSVYSTLATSDAAGNYQTATCTVTRGDTIAWDTNDDCFMEYGVSDQCSLLESNPNCRLRGETIDGVTTVENYMATGLEPLSSCRTLSDTISASCSYSCPAGMSIPCTGSPPMCMVNGTAVACAIINPIESAVRTCGSTLNGSVTNSNVVALNCATFTFQPGFTVTGSASGHDPRHSGVYCYDTSDGSCFGWGGVNNALFCVTGLKVTCSGAYAGLQLQQVYQVGGTELDIISYGCAGHFCAGALASFVFAADQCPIPGGSGCVGNPGFCNKSCSDTDCEPWWTKTRTYTCTTNGYDFSAIQKRASTIKQSVQDNTSSMSYNDYLLSGSGWANTGSSYDTSGVYRGNMATCQQACKTVANVDNSATNVAYKKSDVSLDTTTPQFYYHACTSAGCPAGPGETIVTDCQCIDDFAEAAVIMQTLRKGAQDIICSDGTAIGLQ